GAGNRRPWGDRSPGPAPGGPRALPDPRGNARAKRLRPGRRPRAGRTGRPLHDGRRRDGPPGSHGARTPVRGRRERLSGRARRQPTRVQLAARVPGLRPPRRHRRRCRAGAGRPAPCGALGGAAGPGHPRAQGRDVARGRPGPRRRRAGCAPHGPASARAARRRGRARGRGRPRPPLPRGPPARVRGLPRPPRPPPGRAGAAGAMGMSVPELVGDRAALERVVALALTEDLGTGDATSEAVVDAGARCRAEILLKEPGVVAGLAAAAAVFEALDPGVRFDALVEEGAVVERAPLALAALEGPARAILAGERTALNLLGRLSGVATLTRAYVDAVEG